MGLLISRRMIAATVAIILLVVALLAVVLFAQPQEWTETANTEPAIEETAEQATEVEEEQPDELDATTGTQSQEAQQAMQTMDQAQPPQLASTESAADTTPSDCIPSCQGAAIRRGEVPLTEQEEATLRESGILAPETEVPSARAQPQWQTSDPDGAYYHPPQGPCLGQCTDAYGRNNAEIQTEHLRELGLLP